MNERDRNSGHVEAFRNLFCNSPKMTEDNSNSNDHPAERDEDMSPYRKPAASVISFKLIYSKDDLQSRKVIHFRPEMSHQVFGEDETIFGYRTLSITINYLHNSSRCFVDVLKEGILKSTPMPQLDDIMKCLEPWLPEKFTTEKEEFLKMIENERHDNMYGALLSEFKDKQECKVFPNQKVFADYKICICDMKNEEFKEFHKRFETYIVWFIDAANFIDLDDERWMLYYVYEEFQHPETKATYRTPVGYCSVYKFFAYPNNIRTRISQFFILPSHQRRGIGSSSTRPWLGI
ncbi:hypothetical protein NQ318_013845 [Aromia moschata]|uniref:histone acetyltransferase n=1 Tax=Aromia moschata TaxID=1265417 RepID=A0AAV8ZAZ3_9CUCU|nr:hypothetical protein NQ318_013845 [Aromia moschata]